MANAISALARLAKDSSASVSRPMELVKLVGDRLKLVSEICRSDGEPGKTGER